VSAPRTYNRVYVHQEEAIMSRTIWFVLWIIGLIVVIIWVLNRM
jgi:hypothetical protein